MSDIIFMYNIIIVQVLTVDINITIYSVFIPGMYR